MINGNYDDEGALLKKTPESVHFESDFRERNKETKQFIYDTCMCIKKEAQRTGWRLDNEKVNELAGTLKRMIFLFYDKFLG